LKGQVFIIGKNPLSMAKTLLHEIGALASERIFGEWSAKRQQDIDIGGHPAE
jgi:hypothetical protein